MCCPLTGSDRRPGFVFVSGSSNSGKTTLIELLIPRLRARGIRVGTIKHTHHGFEMDQPGKDSWRHARAGSQAVAVIGLQRAAWLVDTEEAWSVAQAAAPMVGRVDLVLVEGFKSGAAESLIRLESNASARLRMEGAVCRIGVLPSTLEPEELEQIAAFCLGGVRCRPLPSRA